MTENASPVFKQVVTNQVEAQTKEVEDIKKNLSMIEGGFINESGLDFTDISTEEYRVYEFPDYKVQIQTPTHLNVSKNGHRVLDADGISHYIPFGWRHLYWKAKTGKANFVK
jgi:hypothetical protein